jgi:hypothetical protein
MFLSQVLHVFLGLHCVCVYACVEMWFDFGHYLAGDVDKLIILI